MERIKPNKTVTAILCSDFHLREDKPVCRTDNYWETQWKKVDFISDLQKKYGCPIWHGGDLFHHWKPSPELLSMTSQHIPNMFVTVYGNHDLPQHNLDLVQKCGIYNLMVNAKISVLQNGHWGQSLGDGRTGFIINNKQATIQHIMTYQGVEPWPGCTDPKASKLLRQHKQFDLILTGDNHKSFVEEFEGRLLVNPGSIMRMTADQADFQPRVALWFAEDNSIEWVNLPIQKDAISREHLQVKEERDARIDAFVSSLDGDYKTEMSFEENLESFFQVNTVRDSVKQIIYKSLE
jgi:DNA repair exonuclease SbcCD nuclease subunit